MSNADFAEYNLFGGSGRVQTVLRPTSTRSQSLVCAQNLDNGRAFSASMADSINRSATLPHRFIRAWDHGASSNVFPANLYLNWDGQSISGMTRFWTRTDSHDGGFYQSREGYGSRNGLRQRPDQMVAFSRFLRMSKQRGFLIASLEHPTGRFCHFMPWQEVIKSLKNNIKIELVEIESWPGFKLDPRTGLYDINLNVLDNLIKRCKPATEDNGKRWW